MRNGRARRRFLELGQKHWPSWPPRLKHSPHKKVHFSSQLFDLVMNFPSDPFFENRRKAAREGGGVGRISHFSRVFRQLGWVIKVT